MNMSSSLQPLLHDRTKLSVDVFLKRPFHALLLTGEEGSGKYYLAQWIAERLSTSKITLLPPEDKTVITIDQIRELYNVTRTGSSLTIIVKDAQIMRSEAHNAFLKLLEEPPKNTFFILTAPSTDQLPQTIGSRCQTIEVVSPSKKQLIEYANNISTEIDEAKKIAYIHSSGGRIGTFLSLLDNKKTAENHDQLLAEAKEFYSGSRFEKHVIATVHKYEKSWTLELLNVIRVIISALLKQSADSDVKTKKLIAQANDIQDTAHAISTKNANVKIQLTRLIESL